MKSARTKRIVTVRGALLALLVMAGIVAGCATGKPEAAADGQGAPGQVPQGRVTTAQAAPGQAPQGQAVGQSAQAPRGPGSGGVLAGAVSGAAPGASAGAKGEHVDPPSAAGDAAARERDPALLRLPSPPPPPPPPPPETPEQRRARLEALWRRLGLDFVLVPGGEFEMATRQGGQARHLERVPAFLLARTEITVAQFRAFTEATGYKTSAESDGQCRQIAGDHWETGRGATWRDPGFPQRDDHPVVCVSWLDAQVFCEWAGVRLPTEAEWEYAAGHGTPRRAFSWGDGAPSGRRSGNIANEEVRRVLGLWWAAQGNNRGHDDGHVYTAPAGSYEPGPLGLLDMTGNVNEWTATAWNIGAAFGGRPSITGRTYALRGGGWQSVIGNAQVSSASSYFRYNKSDFIGFRVAADLP